MTLSYTFEVKECILITLLNMACFCTVLLPEQLSSTTVSPAGRTQCTVVVIKIRSHHTKVTINI